MKRALAASTPDIGFYGEEGGGADAAHRARVGRRPARRHDQLRHRLAAVRRDARAARGRRAGAGRDRPAVPGRARGLDRRRGGRRRRASTRRSSRMGDAFHRGGAADGRLPGAGQRGAPPRAALPLRRRGLGAVDVARGRPDPGHVARAQQPVRRRRRPRDRARGGRGRDRLRGRAADAGLDRRDGRRAGHPRRAGGDGGRPRGDVMDRRPAAAGGWQFSFLRSKQHCGTLCDVLALDAAVRARYFGGSSDARAAPRSTQSRERGVVGAPRARRSRSPSSAWRPGGRTRARAARASASSISSGGDPHDHVVVRASRRRPCCR